MVVPSTPSKIAPSSDSLGIDIYQKLASVARSDDRTMAPLAKWILDHQDETRKLTISELAGQTDVSDTTVFRFCKLLGLKGYKDLRFALVEGRGLALGTQMAGRTGASAGSSHDDDDQHTFGNILQGVVEANIEQLLRTANTVSHDALERTTAALLHASQIHIVGFGSSAPIAIDACRRFLSLGFNATAHSDPHILAIVTANAGQGAVFVGVSSSGRTRDLIDCFVSVGKRGLPRILLTSDPDAPASKEADQVLVSAVRRMPPALDVVGTRVSQLAIIEVICVALAENCRDNRRFKHNTDGLDAEIAKKRLPGISSQRSGQQED